MGFMPIANGLPVSFTQQLDKHRRIMKHTQGTIDGWTLHPDDAQRVAMASDTELVLEHMPLKLYVKKRSEDPMPQHMGLEPQVYAVSPKGVNWNLDKNSPGLQAHWRVGSRVSLVVLQALFVSM